MVTYGLIGIRPPRASMIPPTVAVTAKATLSVTTSRGEDVTRKRRSRRRDQQREHQQCPHYLDGQRHADSQQHHKADAQRPDGHTPRFRHLRVHARKSERTPDRHQGNHHHQGGRGQHLELDGVHGHDLPRQEAELV